MGKMDFSFDVFTPNGNYPVTVRFLDKVRAGVVILSGLEAEYLQPPAIKDNHEILAQIRTYMDLPHFGVLEWAEPKWHLDTRQGVTRLFRWSPPKLRQKGNHESRPRP